MNIEVSPKIFFALYLAALGVPLLAVISAYVAAVPRLTLPIIQPSEAFNIGWGRVFATGGFAISTVLLCTFAVVRYLALTALADPERPLRWLEFAGCIAMCSEALSLTGVAVVPWAVSGEWHWVMTVLFFTLSCVDVALRLQIDRHIGSIGKQQKRSQAIILKRVLACAMSFSVLGLVAAAFLLQMRLHVWAAFIINGIAELGFAIFLISFHATDCYLFENLSLSMTISMNDVSTNTSPEQKAP